MGNIIFKSIKFKNFMSYGNEFTELPLNNNEMALITGTNGTGKSSMIDAINYGLFGKPYRKVRLNNLVNRYTKKKMVVEIEFTSNQKEWKIVRGISPAIFEIYENNVLVPQQNTNEYQKWLENNVLGFDETIFRQIITIGSGYFVPFLKLSLQQRREIIEHLFDLGVFSVMKDINKEKIKKCNENLTTSFNQIEIIKTQLNAYKDEFNRAKKYNEEQEQKQKTLENDLKRDIEEQTLFIENKQKEMKLVNKSILELDVNEDKWIKNKNELTEAKVKLQFLSTEKSDKIKILNNVMTEIKKNQESLEKNNKKILNLSTSKICPTCGSVMTDIAVENTRKELQDISDELIEKNKILCENNSISDTLESIEDWFNSSVKQYREKIEYCSIIDKEISDLKEIKEKMMDNMREINSKILVAENKIKTSRYNLEKMNEMISLIDLDSLTNKIQNSDKDYNEKMKEVSKMSIVMDYLRELDFVLADNGVRTLVIKRYLTIINKKLNEFLTLLGAEYQINFNEEFDSKITLRMNEEIDYDNFSGGEKLRIDLAIMLTFQSFIKMKATTNTNLLFMDEILDSSLDNSGMIALTEVLKMFLKNGFTVYVISHREENKNLDAFGCIYNVSQPGNFSILEKK